MKVVKQLYHLQEIDLELESSERAQNQIASQLGESQVVNRAQAKLKLEHQHLEELKREQHSAEWEIDDLITKLTTAEKKLYNGSIKNPKELSNLQHEIDGLKTKRDQLEDKALELMDKVELTETSVASLSSQLKQLEDEWQRQQQQLSSRLKQLKTELSDLEYKRQLLLAQTDPQAVEFYHHLKKQKGTAVAKVEQGICHGCRISLPTTDLQQARSGNLVQCSSCGRILFLA
jgi:predicted  nucleic acid-binding Zn-ribbon protein